MKYVLFVLSILIFLFSISVAVASYLFSTKIKTEIAELLAPVKSSDSEKLTEEMIKDLPAPVRNWLHQTGAVGNNLIKVAIIKQNLQMKLKQEQQNWFNAIATQYSTTENPGFIWQVKMQMFPAVFIKGRDKYFEGKGEMLIKLNSLINVVNETGEKLDEGTLQRYLGEIVWYPTAVISPYIKWEEVDSLSVRATMDYKGVKASGTFYFNEKFDFVKFSAMRYNGNSTEAKRFEWIIEALDYKEFDGFSVPVKLKATWKFDTMDWTWLQMEIAEITYNRTF